MRTVEDGVRKLIGERYGSVPKLSTAIGLPAQTIYSALRNGLAGASTSTTMPIAEALGLDPFKLAQGKVEPLPNAAAQSINVPLYGSIVAGKPLEPEYAEDSFPIPMVLHKAHPHAYLLRVEGESMSRVLPNGCYALVDPKPSAIISGRIYAVAIGEQKATVKRIKLLENGLTLLPDSNDPTFRPQIFDFGQPETETISLIGEVVWYCPPVQWNNAE